MPPAFLAGRAGRGTIFVATTAPAAAADADSTADEWAAPPRLAAAAALQRAAFAAAAARCAAAGAPLGADPTRWLEARGEEELRGRGLWPAAAGARAAAAALLVRALGRLLAAQPRLTAEHLEGALAALAPAGLDLGAD